MPGSHCLAPCFLLWGHCCQWCQGEHLLFLPSQQGRSIFPLEQRHTLPFFNLWFIEHNWGFFYRLSNQLPRRDGLVTPLSWDQKLILCQVVVFVYFIKENRRGRGSLGVYAVYAMEILSGRRQLWLALGSSPLCF